MLTEEIVRQLQLTHFLRGLDESRLHDLAQRRDRRTLEPGEFLLTRGDTPTDLYIVLRGSLTLLQEDPEGQLQPLRRFEEGSLIGAMELLTGASTPGAIRADESTELLVWPKRSLYKFLEGHPAALASLRLTADTQSALLGRDFEWLADDEAIFALGRRHISLLGYKLLAPTLIALAGAALLWWMWGADTWWQDWVVGLLGVIAAGTGAWQWIDWRNDYYVVTDQRAIWLEKVVAIYDSRVETPLHQVLAVSVSTDVLGRWLGYGDVVIRTYTGQIEFEHVARPRAVAAIVEERWRRLQLQERSADRSEKLAALRELVEPEEPGEDEPAAQPHPSEAAEQEPPPEVGLNHWNLELRFEDQGVITYRKHWAVLLREIALPSVVFLLLVGAIGGRLGEMFTMLPLPSFLLLAGGALLVVGTWWAYQFADWANDVYQVSPTHIVDLYRKPLGRELRRAAPLENILSTEVDRRGIVGLLLDFGDVRINVGAEQLDFVGVFHPNSVQQDIVRAQEAFLARKREAEEEQRKREMVEWLGVYHDEIASQDKPSESDRDTDVYP